MHRDIKPANIFVNARGQVKILDFGLAKFERRSADPATARHDETHASDDLTTAGHGDGHGVLHVARAGARASSPMRAPICFRSGTVLYQMATGALPFHGDTPAVVFDAILNRDPAPLAELNPAVPADLGRILDKALEKDRNLRYQIARPS